jgi:sterol desaturase/sphingolipid hydroxylase (fatty acid hydroxylase superfamily)
MNFLFTQESFHLQNLQLWVIPDMMNKKQAYPSLRIFENPILEAMTHVHPIVPLLLWGPVVLGLSFYALFIQGLSLIPFLLIGFGALLAWTLFEYVLHRYLFHYPAKSRLGKYLVFLFHGLHHDDPNDPTRLVFPPVPAILIVLGVYGLFSLIIPFFYLNAFMAFFLIGYLCYDYIHYATHHFPMTGKVGRYLKKFHLQHHFKKERARYGVSSPLWDYVFGTVTGPHDPHYDA